MRKNWIKSPVATGEAVVVFKKDFHVSHGVRVVKATLQASAMGVYNAYLNGEKIGDALLAPGWTSYRNRIFYQTYDILPLLKESNELAIGVGQGWAILDKNLGRFYTDHLSLNAQVILEYEDGKKEAFYTDESWKAYTDEVTFAGIYHGETIDKTFVSTCLGNAEEDKSVRGKCVKQNGEWIKEQERIAPVALIITPNGEKVIDFGQNLTGYVEMKITAPRGSKTVIHHGEVLDQDGNFYNANYRSSRNIITYISSGEQDIFKPRYTFQGFRYIRLSEYPFEEVNLNNFTAIVVHSDMHRTGEYRCGNDKVNQLYHNIIWGQKCNYLDVPTDCPQRDERLAWTGDTQVFCRTGAINYDVKKFFAKWLEDLALEQRPDGAIGTIAPIPYVPTVSAAWSDAACIVPWEIFMAYGDKKLLRRNFPMMKKWVDYIHNCGEEEFLWLDGSRYGDWLAMDAGADSYSGATSKDLIAAAFFANSTNLVIRAGEALGEDIEEYKKLYKNIVKRFREYFTEKGSLRYEKAFRPEIYQDTTCAELLAQGATQTDLILILHFHLCTEKERPAYAKKLVELIEKNGNKMSTGFVGTPYILHALTANGYEKVAYDLLLQEKSPSWLYSVCHGATTMWEHWNSIKEDGSFWSTDMNSFNHYAYGAVFDWIFGVSSGIKPIVAGYKKVSIAPVPDKRLGFAEASIQTKYGKIRSYWCYQGDEVVYEFEIPSGVTAEITLPSGVKKVVKNGIFRF